MFMFKKLVKWLVIAISVLVTIFLLLRLGFKIAYTIKPELGYRYIYNYGPNVIKISAYGSNREFISVSLDGDDKGRVTMSQKYLVNVHYKQRIDQKSSNLKIDDGESIEIETYQLDTPDFTKRSFDLIPILQKQGFNHQVVSVHAITYQNEDYLYLKYKIDDINTDVVWYNIETKKIVKPLSRDYQDIYQSFGEKYFKLGITSKIIDEYNILPDKHALNNNYDKAKNLQMTNLSVDYPKIAKNLTDGGAVYVRSDLINEETWFNTILHWFAPKGQEIMEIYAKDSETGEKTQIKSYADFEEWKKVHPSK